LCSIRHTKLIRWMMIEDGLEPTLTLVILSYGFNLGRIRRKKCFRDVRPTAIGLVLRWRTPVLRSFGTKWVCFIEIAEFGCKDARWLLVTLTVRTEGYGWVARGSQRIRECEEVPSYHDWLDVLERVANAERTPGRGTGSSHLRGPQSRET
jgi:hypothetical protein